MDDEKIIELRKPVTIGKDESAITYTSLTLREPTAGELSKATKAGNDIDTAIALISIISKTPKSAIENLCQRDLQECSDFLASFSTDSRTTG
ncbi:MAG: phage tail assembly protein [Pseudomonadota bacterium]|nr:phage tail assembly protein [Pseudomonadota bacterium]